MHNENKALKEENERLQLIINSHMKKFQCFGQEVKDAISSEETKELARNTEMAIVNNPNFMISNSLRRKLIQ